jgi:hypothetical protein
MIINSIMRNGCYAAVLALTAQERWAGARRVDPQSNREYLLVLAIALLLMVLVLLLWWVSYRRHATPRAPAQDLFSDSAARKGLVPRERQVLLAIVARSGLRRNHDIFTTPDAFDRGAARLLEECARGRTPQERERLRVELANLRTRLAYRMPAGGQQAGLTSSRDIAVEHARRGDLAIHAPATVAHFPFIQTATQPGDMAPTDWFELVRGTVTQVSATGLQVSSSLSVSVGERVLVMFALTPAGADDGTRDARQQCHIIVHVGRVSRRQAAGEETVMTVDLTDLAGREIGELLRLVQAAASGTDGPVGARVTQGA